MSKSKYGSPDLEGRPINSFRRAVNGPKKPGQKPGNSQDFEQEIPKRET